MARLNDDCIDLDNFTERWSTSNVDVSIEEDATSPGGYRIKIVKTGAGRPLLTLDAADGGANEGALLTYTPSSGSKLSLCIGASGSSGSEFTNMVELNEPSNTIRLWRGSNGSYNTLSGASGFTITAGTMYNVRIHHFPNQTIAARIWEHGTEEPTSYNVTGSTAAASSGWVGVSELSSSTTTYIHRLSASTAYDSPCELDDADIPTDGKIILADDASLRILGGSLTYPVSIRPLGAGLNPKTVRFHPTLAKYYYTANGDDAIYRCDQLGLNQETIVSSFNQAYGLSFDLANDLMYYTNNEASGELMVAGVDGSDPTQLVTGISTPTRCFFNPEDGLIYVVSGSTIASYDDEGTLDTTYLALSSGLTGVAADDTNVYAVKASASGFYAYAPIGGGSWTSGTTYRPSDIVITPSDITKALVADSITANLVEFGGLPGLSLDNDTVLSATDSRSADYVPASGGGGGGGAARPGCLTLGLGVMI